MKFKFKRHTTLIDDVTYLPCKVMSDFGSINIRKKGEKTYQVSYTDGYQDDDLLAFCKSLKEAKEFAIDWYNNMNKVPDIIGNL